MRFRTLTAMVIFALASSMQVLGTEPDKNFMNDRYLGLNPVAYITVLQLPDDVKRYIPEIAGLEYGFSLIGGSFPYPKIGMEVRFAWGDIHQIAHIGQLHFGANYFSRRNSEKWEKGLYLGGFFKFWDYYNKLTEVHFFNISPYITAGYIIDIEPVFMDIRINQTLAVFSWSSLEHSSSGVDWFLSPWPEFIPILPSLTVSVARRF